MPIHLPPTSRRRFLGQVLGAATLAGARCWAAEAAAETAAERWCLLSDTHVAADRAQEARGVNMAANLARVAAEVLALQPPRGVFVNGDLALNTGEVGDYATFGELIAPLRRAGLPLHLTLGNHDHRANVRAALQPPGGADLAGADKLAGVVVGATANWFLLDSLEEVNRTPGSLGAAQQAWLARELDARADRPAIVMVHHNPDLGEKRTGLKDTETLWEILADRKQVKALIYGHTHNWSVTRHASGIHEVNLPPVAYVFGAGKPNGWVEAETSRQGMRLKLSALDRLHPDHGRWQTIQWR